MDRLLPRNGVAIDVGAHKGAYSYRMAKRVGPAGRVIGIEPQQRLAARTAAALHAAGLRRVEIIQAAASDRQGPVSMDYRESSTHGAALDGLQGPGVRSTTVEAVTLDAVAAARSLPRVDFIKIDVEGHEQAVLRGSLGILQKHHPALLVEIEARHHAQGGDPLAAAQSLLAPLGYETYAFVGRACRRADSIDPAILRAVSGDRPGVSNNFLFVTPERAASRGLAPR